MRFRTKVAIFMVALLLSLGSFNMIISSGLLDMLKVGKFAGYEMVANVVSEVD